MQAMKTTRVISELLLSSQEMMMELAQQLAYFKASVYKNELAAVLREKIEILRVTIQSIGDASLSDCFLDYDAEVKEAYPGPPGECSFSSRIARLLVNLDATLRTRLDLSLGGTSCAVSSKPPPCKKEAKVP